MTRGQQKKQLHEKESFSHNDLHTLPELHPPVDVMPYGNVGTPTKTFLQLIQQCKLPPAVINKLGLSFPKTRTNRRYGNVPFEYDCTKDDTSENASNTLEKDVIDEVADVKKSTNEKDEKLSVCDDSDSSEEVSIHCLNVVLDFNNNKIPSGIYF